MNTSWEELSVPELREQWFDAVPSARDLNLVFLEYLSQTEGFWTKVNAPDYLTFQKEWYAFGTRYPKVVETILTLLSEYWRRAHGGPFPKTLRIADRITLASRSPRFYSVQHHPSLKVLGALAQATLTADVRSLLRRAPSQELPLDAETVALEAVARFAKAKPVFIPAKSVPSSASSPAGVEEWEAQRRVVTSVAAVLWEHELGEYPNPYLVLADLHRHGGPLNSVLIHFREQEDRTPPALSLVWDRHRALECLAAVVP